MERPCDSLNLTLFYLCICLCLFYVITRLSLGVVTSLHHFVFSYDACLSYQAYLTRYLYVFVYYVCAGDHPLTAEAIARKIGLITTRTRKDVARERGVPLESVSHHRDPLLFFILFLQLYTLIPLSLLK